MKSAWTLYALSKYLFILLIATSMFVGFQNCAKTNSNQKAVAADVQPLSVSAISHYKYDRKGGGQLGYEIQDSGLGYTVQVNSYGFINYLANQKTFFIPKTVPSSLGARLDGEQDVISLMTGSCKFLITNPNPPCPDCLTGTWSTEFITTENNQTPIQIYGLDSCTSTVDTNKIWTLITNIARNSNP